MTTRVNFMIRDREARLVRKLARAKGVSSNDILRLAVWAYILPMVPSLAAPVELPPVEQPAPSRAPRRAATRAPARKRAPSRHRKNTK
jgi:hypothetical protein